MADNLVYLVIGGCGFLGSHIVELLTKEDYVSEVRIFDTMEHKAVKGLTTGSTEVKFIKGDITEYSQLLEAMQGVHVVIHTAALLDYLDILPFSKMKAVNVGGTENVIKACCALSIQYMVYTSSIAALGPNSQHVPMLRGTEDTEYLGEPNLSYGKTKAMAEKCVLKASGEKLTNGKKLVTCIIRPSEIYGEKQKEIENRYMLAKSRRGLIVNVEPNGIERNYSYVGNVAWMHVLAARNLLLKPDILDGQIFYSYDDTPFKQRSLLMHDLFLEVDDTIQLGPVVPYWKMFAIISIYQVVKFLLKPFWTLKPFYTIPVLNLVVTSFSYETDKAFRHFGYRPLYTWAESKSRVTQWLKFAKGNLGAEK